MNSDCPLNSLSCVNQKCVNPCLQGICPTTSKCTVINHSPQCYCDEGYTGNPSVHCTPIENDPIAPINPCSPSPCGPYSNCKDSSGHAVCSCLKNYIGVPPACRPECSLNSDCPSTKLACINSRCVDPCIATGNLCGLNAICNVIQHNPICTCPPGQTGDPFTRCFVEQSKRNY